MSSRPFTPNLYPLSLLLKEKDQTHPFVALLIKANEWQDEGKAILAKVFSPDSSHRLDLSSDRALWKTALARFAACIRAERDVFAPTRVEAVQLMGIIQQLCPHAAGMFKEGATQQTIPVLSSMTLPPGVAWDMDAVAVTFELVLAAGAPVEFVVQQVIAARDEFMDLDAPHLYTLAAGVVPMWRQPIYLCGRAFGPGDNKLDRLLELLTRAIDTSPPGDIGLGELLWMKAATLHRDEGKARPGVLWEMRECLLRSARLTPLGAPYLRNVFLRLAMLVYECALPSGERIGAPLSRNFSGAEAILLRELLARAEQARVAQLGVYVLRLGGKAERPDDAAISTLVAKYDAALHSGMRCTLCEKSNAQLRCAFCATVYCSERCQGTDWKDATRPHKGSCALIAQARASILKLSEFGSTKTALEGEVLAAIGPSWRLVPKPPIIVEDLD